jgi:amino acid transporter
MSVATNSAVVAPAHGAAQEPRIGEKGLKANALGYLSNIVIGVASTAPAYSLAATLGFIVAVGGVGVHAPAVLIVAFIPMLLVSVAYRYLNRADPDAGTTFAWVTRALGPQLGWLNGWAIFVADVIVMASLSVIASTYTYLLFGWQSGANSTTWIIIGAAVWIALMSGICYRGIELSARIQQFLLGAEILILGVFAVVALIKAYTGTPAGGMHVSGSWFNPFDIGWTALVDGVLLGLFIYWGWDSGVAVNEESEDPAEGPGRAAVMSTIVLLLVYVIVSTAAQAYGGTGYLAKNSSDVLSVLGGRVFGSGWDKLLILAVLTSAAASTQTTILPTARTTLSMARWGAIPAVFGRIHPRYLTPSVSTLAMGAISILWTVVLVAFNPAQNVLGDSITALGFSIAFYYGFTGLACFVYYRHELRRRWRNLLLAGIVPLLGCLAMFAVFGKAFHDYSQPGSGLSSPLFGVQIPIVIGIGTLLLGIPLLALAWTRYRSFFARRPETAPEGILEVEIERAPAHF